MRESKAERSDAVLLKWLPSLLILVRLIGAAIRSLHVTKTANFASFERFADCLAVKARSSTVEWCHKCFSSVLPLLQNG